MPVRFLVGTRIPGVLLLVIFAVGCAGGNPGKQADLWSPPMPASVREAAPALDLRHLEMMVHQEVNLLREHRGKNSLAWSDTIAYVARLHSENMAAHAYFGHTDSEGLNASERASKMGLAGPKRTGNFITAGLGENLFATHRYAEYVTTSAADTVSYSVIWKAPNDIAREAVDAWLKSPKHRTNLLSDTYSQQGIGIALGSNGVLFVTQNLY